MTDPKLASSFPILLQRFFVEHLGNQRAVSSRTIAAYRDTFRLLLDFAEATIGKAPTRLTLADLDAQLILSFLDHLEKERSNGARTRNAAAERYPQLARRSISPHTIRHITAMHLLQSGVDISVIALWLGHESPATTHMYLQADLAMKERTLNRLQPMTASQTRYRPPDQLMQFLLSL
ncbi:tyrosine-type recombinase/integrase [Mesorhizobium sp. M0578]|uniref:tyrosine-type recombinase/integrase n=1 Tax=unclassified Mesorhizobium TaxID=325217 RepID=UPI00333A6D57